MISFHLSLNLLLLFVFVVPKEAIESLWLSYNLLGDNWGLSAFELNAVFNDAVYFKRICDFSQSDTENLFIALDTDCNGYIDALEMCVALALVSGMDIIEKMQFVFCCYDFETRGSLSFQEASLLLLSVINSCSKLFPGAFPFFGTFQVENLTTLLFTSMKKTQTDRISIGDFQVYCISHPVYKTWLNFLGTTYGYRLNRKFIAHDCSS